MFVGTVLSFLTFTIPKLVTYLVPFCTLASTAGTSSISLLRQIRKCQLMKYDIEEFDRAPEKSEQKSYAFLLRNIRDLLDRERLRSNWNRIVEKNKQTEKPQPAAPAQGGKDRGRCL